MGFFSEVRKIINSWAEQKIDSLVGNCTLGGQAVLTAYCLGQAICCATDAYLTPNLVSRQIYMASTGLYLGATLSYSAATACSVICPPSVHVVAGIGHGFRKGGNYLDKSLLIKNITDLTKGI